MNQNEAPEATWPENESDANADRMIACATHHAVMLDAMISPLSAAVPWDNKEHPNYTSTIRRHADAVAATVTAAQYATLLVEVQKLAPESADQIAQRLWRMTEDGEWLITSLWEYLSDRGYDANGVYREAEERARKRA
ncbi:hypothetical protein AB0P00_17605 [Microbacterium sp. NPDC077057]|uniref:hypothetical protein n=1 Tax=Microbacterium sp. NPDC077057 TaxID=3154763 RepID=UPI003439F079